MNTINAVFLVFEIGLFTAFSWMVYSYVRKDKKKEQENK